MGPFSVLHPALLWGALGISVPVVIHLLSRRRRQVVEWAAMDFLFSAHRRSRKRVKMEHWLVLLLRCLAILLLALLVARPRFHAGSGPTGVTVLPSPAEHIVVLDDSPSMLLRGHLQTPATRAREQLLDWVDHLQEQRPRDVITVLTTAAPDQPLYRSVRPTPELRRELETTLDERNALAGQAGRPRLLSSLQETLARPGACEWRTVYLLSDLRAADWEQDARHEERGTGGFKALAEACNLVAVVDCAGEGGGENCGVVDLRPASGGVVDGVPATFRVSVRNYGETPAEGLVVDFGEHGGVRKQYPMPTIEPRSQETLLCDLTVRDTEWIALEAGIGDDDLAADNMRRYGAAVASPTRVLLVDGADEPGGRPGPAYYVHMALTPPGPMRFGYRVETLPAGRLEDASPDEADIIVLCDVAYPVFAEDAGLRTWIEDGGALVVFLGERCEADAYNRLLYRDGDGVLPVALQAPKAMADRRDSGLSLTVADPQHRVVSIFRGEANPFLEKVRIRRWWQTRMDEDARVSVLCRLADPQQTPLLVEKRIGSGRVYVMGTTPEPKSGNWVSDPSFVVVMHQLATSPVRGRGQSGPLEAGTPLVVTPDLDIYDPELVFKRLDDEEAVAETLTAEPVAEGGVAVRFEDTRMAGWYRVGLQRRDGRPEERLYAVNVPATEGDPKPADRAAVRSRLEADGARLVPDMQSALSGAQRRQRELWKPIGWLLLAVLGLEHVLSWWFLRKREVGH